MKAIHAPLVLAAMLTVVAFADSSAAAPGDDGFDRQSAASVLSQIDLTKCRAPNAPRGEGHVVVTFKPGGAATNAVVDRGPMVGSPAAKCIGAQFAKAKIAPFKGQPIQVGKLFRFQ